MGKECLFPNLRDRSERLQGSQLALRFNPVPFHLLDLDKKSVDAAILQRPAVLKALQVFAKYQSFFSLDYVPIPNRDKIRRELGENWDVDPVVGCGVCGSDDTTKKLGWSPSVLAYKGDKIEPFTVGHEVLVRTEEGICAVYPLLDCQARGKDLCPHCQAGQENQCERFSDKINRIQGLALGFGAKLVTNERKSIELGGGFSQFVAVNENQLFPIGEMSLQQASFIDAAACANCGVEKVLGKDKPILVIGFGPIGLTTVNALQKRGINMQNVTVLVKYPLQEKIARQFGCKVINIRERDYQEKLAYDIQATYIELDKDYWIEGGYPVVFDCVGSQESFNLTSRFVGKEGRAVMTGLPQIIKADMNLLAMRGITPHFPFWATRDNYKQAIEDLATSQFSGWEEIVKGHQLTDALKAFNPTKQDKEKFIKHLIIPS